MREIIFRGKRCDNGEWVYGYYVESHHSWKGHKPHKSWIVGSPITNGGWFNLLQRYAVKDDTVGQYTGLTDKNGNKIFEGDIVREVVGYKRIGYVGWLQQECGFVTVWNKSDFRLGHRNRGGGYENDPSLEVIGNIIDTPELLKG